MSWRLCPSETALLVVDAQEKLVAAVQQPTDWLERLEILVKGSEFIRGSDCDYRAGADQIRKDGARHCSSSREVM